MEVSFATNAEPVVSPTHRNVFALEIESMSGDADAYQTVEQVGELWEGMPLLVAVKAIIYLLKKEVNGGLARDEVAQIIGEVIGSDDEEDGYEIASQLLGSDVTCPDYFAMPSELNLYWYNDEGKKCAASFIVDGVEYSTISRWTFRNK